MSFGANLVHRIQNLPDIGSISHAIAPSEIGAWILDPGTGVNNRTLDRTHYRVIGATIKDHWAIRVTIKDHRAIRFDIVTKIQGLSEKVRVGDPMLSLQKMAKIETWVLHTPLTAAGIHGPNWIESTAATCKDERRGSMLTTRDFIMASGLIVLSLLTRCHIETLV